MSRTLSRKDVDEVELRPEPMPKFGGRYALFEKRDGNWVRISHYAFYLKIARQMFQHILVEAAAAGIEQKLRRVHD